MSVDTARYISLAAFALSGIFLTLAIVLFFKDSIPKVFGDISGRAARREIEIIRRGSAGERSYKPTPIDIGKIKIKDKVTPSGNLMPLHSGNLGINLGTDELDTDELAAEIAPERRAGQTGGEGSGETEVLGAPPATYLEAEITLVHTDRVIDESV